MPDGSTSDEFLMGSLKKEDTHALRMLIERWETRLLVFAYRYIQDESTARDLVQETFVRVYQNRDRFDESRRFSTWLFGIAVNLCRNRQRWLSRHAESPLEVAPEPVDMGTPREQVDRDERVRAVMESIQKLPHVYRVVILLYYYEEHSYGEIAGILDCSVRGVETRLYRARRILARHLGLNFTPGLEKSGHEHSRIRNPSSHVFCR
jgi:RNA polymerase sigma-70 factor (ECF subfamily)